MECIYGGEKSTLVWEPCLMEIKPSVAYVFIKFLPGFLNASFIVNF